jgi:predicted AAA+ superfamily ATPase
MDTGLACYLSLWNDPRVLENSAMAGAMFETYVVSEIIKEYTNKGIDVRSRLAYYRDNSGKPRLPFRVVSASCYYAVFL